MRYNRLRNYVTPDRKVVLNGELATREELIERLYIRLQDIDILLKLRNSDTFTLLSMDTEDDEINYTLYAHGLLSGNVNYTVVKTTDKSVAVEITPQDYKDMYSVYLELVKLLNLNY